jgi:thiosulfate/3-mercaptopyruvate sulfurtransferase
MRIQLSRPFIRPPAILQKPGFQQRRFLSSPYALENYLVTPHDLNLALQKNVYSKLSTAPRIIPLCATWFMPNDAKKRTGYKSFVESHIPKAQFFDLDAVKDNKSPYPHMLPPPELFAEAMGKLGIRKDDSVVVYDSSELGIFSAPRVAWTLKVFGHDGVHILNNYKLWVDQGYPVEKGEPEPVDAVQYPVPTLDSNKVTAFEELKEKIAAQGKEGAEKIQVLDARPAGRFEGTDPEPRPGIFHPPFPFSQLTISRSLVRSYARQYIYPILRRHIRPHKNFPPGRRAQTLL